MLNYLNKEYFKYNPANKQWQNGLFMSAVILSVFLLLQPFGFSGKDLEVKLLVIPGYAFFAFWYSYFNFLIVRLILKKRKKWTLKNELINLAIGAILLTIVIHLYTFLVLDDMPLTFQWYFKLLYHVSSLFLVIAIIEFFYYNNKFTIIRNEQLASRHQQALQKLSEAERSKDEIITISLEKEIIEFNRNKLAYVQSVGNYLEFFFNDSSGKINKLIKRGRLHKAEKDLSSFPEFYKCHRAFIVNLNHVVRIKGNVKNAKVIFGVDLEEIPVSRLLYKGLKEKLEKIVIS